MSEEIKFVATVGIKLNPDESEQVAKSALKILIGRALKNSPYELIIIKKGEVKKE